MNTVIGTIISLVAVLISFLYLKYDLKPKKNSDTISIMVLVIQGLYILVNFITERLGIPLIFSILRFLYDYPFILAAYILIVAALSPLTACYETKHGFTAHDSYAPKNGLYNLGGVGASYAMFFLAHQIIPNFNLLEKFQIETYTSVFISMSAVLVCLYQSTEQEMDRQGVPMDHDPSIEWLNQRINMLHLFNAYFFPLISTVYIITYTIYCRIYQIPLVINGWYISFLVLALAYFYLLSLHPYEYLYKIFLIATPAILITSTYWLSWFEKDRSMIYIESGFIIINLIFFSLRVLSRTQMPDEIAQKKGLAGFITRWRYILGKNIFSLFLIVIAVVAHLLIACFPLSTERIQSTEAENFVYLICDDTNRDPAQIIEKSHSLTTYDAASGSYDKLDYMDFLSRELKAEIAAKHIVENGRALTYNGFEEWRRTIPINR